MAGTLFPFGLPLVGTVNLSAQFCEARLNAAIRTFALKKFFLGLEVEINYLWVPQKADIFHASFRKPIEWTF
jgi:hypothetical protein